MGIFVSKAETEVIACGIKYLRVEGAFYWGIGCLFLFYGYYRAVKRAGMSVVLTVISLGMRVLLSLCVVCESRRSRYLGGDPHRLGTGRYYRTGLYVKIETLRHVEKAKSRWFGITEAWLFG